MPSLSRTLAVAASSLLLFFSPAAALWPVPTEVSTGNTTLLISQSLDVTYNGRNVAYTYGCAHPSDVFDDKLLVQAAVSRAMKGIFHDNFVPWKLSPRGKLVQPDVYGTKYGWVRKLCLIQTSNNTSSVLTAPDGEADEAYTLEITEAGVATLKAPTLLGLFHGLETFVQLFYKHSSGTYWYTRSAPVSISDSPQYAHRGIMIDGSRNFMPVEDILRTLDAMAWNKLNRLHFHITDSQSWPLELPSMPEVSEKGAYVSYQTYRPADITHIYEYALVRGIQVIMEIDMPGHSGSVALSHPELVVAYNEQPYWYYCAEPPCGAFRLNDTGVYKFLDAMWDDILPRINKYTSYFHTGGDEVNANGSMLDPGVRSNDSAVLQPLVQRFVSTAHDQVRKHDLIPLVWEEMVGVWNLTLGSDVIIQSWLGGNATKKYISQGFQVIDSNYEFWYLDCGRGQWLDFDNGRAFESFYPFNDWCTPTNNWRKMYAHDPRAGLSDADKSLVLGGEVAVWSETIDSTNFDSIVWPRASAMGEVLWSGRVDAAGQNRSQYDASPRLSALRERMVARGVSASPIQMTFCTQADDPLECAYYWP
ncbi:Beta-hexosaminidase [Ceratocystis fimbriata CBS 114723]|uniref:Beta-hexosaminidase n=1 Tax=Ceratocystis fimbriata CBS 114723 TaxID=1035309 RepID=A0A2C5WZ38_9PEZI|nr:Beta-hexosaminidase [Ceratocystis fimbriata CBS 114723]